MFQSLSFHFLKKNHYNFIIGNCIYVVLFVFLFFCINIYNKVSGMIWIFLSRWIKQHLHGWKFYLHDLTNLTNCLHPILLDIMWTACDFICLMHIGKNLRKIYIYFLSNELEIFEFIHYYLSEKNYGEVIGLAKYIILL